MAGFVPRLSLRTQMIAVAFLTLLPSMLFGAYQIQQETVQARQNMEQLVTAIARINAAEISRILRVTETFLRELSGNPDIRALDRTRCGHLFDYFPKIYTQHTNLLTKDIRGNIVCSSLPFPPDARPNVGDYLDEVRHRNGFAVGTPNLGPVSGRLVVPLDFPIRDDSGAIIGTVGAPLDVLNFNPFLGPGAFDGLPEGTTTTLFAPDMTMLARSFEPEKWVGSKRVLVPELTRLVAQRSGTTRFVSAIDHVDRIHGAAPVPGTTWTTLASIPTEPLDAAVGALTRRWVGMGILALLASLVLAYVLARQTARPILRVADVVRKVGQGDLEARISPDGSIEVVAFAEAFNSTLDGLLRLMVERRETAETLEATLDAAPVAVIGWTADGAIVFWSRGAEQMYGYSAAEIVGQLGAAAIVPPDVQHDMPAYFTRLRNGEPLRDVQVRRHRRDGALLTIRFNANPLFDAEGRFRGAVSASEDITAKLKIEEQLRQAQKMEAIGQLTGGVAHDFNNLLGTILLSMDLLQARVVHDTEARETVDTVIEAATRGATLTAQMLAFGRRQFLQPNALDFGQMVAAMSSLIKRAAGETIAVRFDIAPQLWRLHADRAHLESALLNLVINARDAMPRGGTLHIAAGNEVIGQQQAAALSVVPGDYVVIEVRDTGTGMDSATLARAFEPFFTTKDVGKGSGLGLSQVYGFAQQSRGAATIDSVVDHGTTVTLRLPRDRRSADDAPVLADSSVASA